MLFKVYSLHKTAQAWRDDPTHELAGTIRGAIVGYVATAFAVAFLILIGLGVLAFGPWLGGPYVLAKILFFIGLFPLLLALMILGRLLKIIRGALSGNKKPRQSGARVSDDVIDVKIEGE